MFKDTATFLAANFARVAELPHSSLESFGWWSRSSSSITSVSLVITETYWCSCRGLSSISWTWISNLAMMLQSALLASASAEAKGNRLNRPCNNKRSEGSLCYQKLSCVEQLKAKHGKLMANSKLSHLVIFLKLDQLHQLEYLLAKQQR